MNPFEKFQTVIENSQAIQQTQKNAGQRIRSALEAQIALPEQVELLNRQTGELLKIAEAQKQLAEEAGKQADNLSKQTDRLVQETVTLTKLTGGLYWLTFILGVLAAIQIFIMLFDYFSKNH